MKRHEVLGILPFIAAGALGTTAFAEGDQAQIAPNTNTFETTPFGGGKVAGTCGDTSLTQSASLEVVPRRPFNRLRLVEQGDRQATPAVAQVLPAPVQLSVRRSVRLCAEPLQTSAKIGLG